MDVATFVQVIKRKTQVSDVAVTTDQSTTDIINFLNSRAYQFWRSWPWDWGLTAISFNTVIGQSDYTLPSTVGDILALTSGTGGYLKVLSWKRYLQWFLSNQTDPVTGLATVPANGNVTHYVRIGRDGSGNFKLRLWKPPDTVVAVTGFGKTRLTVYTVADIAAGTQIGYFPVEFQDVLEEGVLADVYESMGQKADAAGKEALYRAKIEELQSQADEHADEDPTSPPPDMYIFGKRRRARFGTGVV